MEYYGTENIRTRILDLVRNAQSSVRIIIYWGLVKEEIEELITEISSRVPVEIITDYWEGDTRPISVFTCMSLLKVTSVVINAVPAGCF